MTQERKVETKGSRKSLETARNTWKFIMQDYQEGHEHKKNGKPVVWSCSLVEKELFYAMGLHPFYPEQFAALCAVRRKTTDSEKEAVRFARIAERIRIDCESEASHNLIRWLDEPDYII